MSKEQATVALGDFQKVSLGSIIVDDELNVRKTYTDAHIKTLAKSIEKVGITKPLTVKREGDSYKLLSGFCRVRAVKQLFESGWEKVLVPITIVTSAEMADDLQYNMMDDESAEPPKRSEVAARLHYMVEEVGLKQLKMAEKMSMSSADVSRYISTWKNLEPSIKQVWIDAPTRDKEIPFSKLHMWSKFEHPDQLVAFAKYNEILNAPEVDEEESEDAEEEETETKEILQKLRSKKEVKNELARFAAKLEEAGELSDTETGAMKALSWTLSDRKSLFGRL
jgi:ParB-like chromosome segregation protein Spo0J